MADYLVVSDLHLSSHKKPKKQVEMLPRDVDGIIVAGDVSTVSKYVLPYLKLLCDNFKHVIYVSGNHDYYDISPAELLDIKASCKLSNLSWLENETVTVGTTKLCGTTLWHPKTKNTELLGRSTDGALPQFSDARHIKEYEGFPYRAHQAAMAFLTAEATDGAIVVTHHAPSFSSVEVNYLGNPFTDFYVAPAAQVLLEERRLLWIHGHTHCVNDYRLGSSRVLTNVLGYPWENRRPKIMIVEVG